MKVFLTGASGFVGSAIAQELLEAGHTVIGLARSNESAERLQRAGCMAHRGDLQDTESLRRAAAQADGVIHTAYIHDFSNLAASADVDRVAVQTMAEALAGSDNPMLVTSAIGAMNAGRVALEQDAPDPASPGAHRIAAEQSTRAAAERGVRAMVMRLPPSVHGEGDHGFVPALVRTARQRGVSAFIGDGSNRWCAVHRRDAARAYRLALERGTAGKAYHAVAEQGVAMHEIAAAIARGLGVPLQSLPREQGAGHFTWLTKFAVNDMPASSALTRETLGWRPTQAGLIEDLVLGRYFDA